MKKQSQQVFFNPDNKQLLIIPGATHCDLYDGGEGNYIPWDTLAEFFSKNLLN